MRYNVFDIDGTVQPFVDDMNASYMEKYFIDYNIATEKKNPDSIFILTGCLDKRIFSQEKSNTIDVIAKPILDAVPLRVMSGYGLPCYDREGNIYLHPIMKEIAPTVKRIYKAVKEFQEIMSGEPLLYEIKKTGLTINTKQVRSLDQQKKIQETAREHFSSLIKDTKLIIADKHGSIEIRPEVGKKDSLIYQIEHGIFPANATISFFCDSLSEQGADRCLADHFIANGHSIIQVLNGKPRCAGAKHTFVTPCDLARELKAGFTPFH